MPTDPEIFRRCVVEQTRKGKSDAAASAICQARLEKSASIKPGTRELTERGSRREALATAASRRESPARKAQERTDIEKKRADDERKRRKAASGGN